MSRVHNVNVLFSFGAGVQSQETQINVPFPVKRLVIHPPRHNAAAAGDQYLLYSSINKGSGIVGMIDAMHIGVQAEPITVVFDEPVHITGYHRFWTRCFVEAGGGAVTALTARVWQHIECHSE